VYYWGSWSGYLIDQECLLTADFGLLDSGTGGGVPVATEPDNSGLLTGGGGGFFFPANPDNCPSSVLSRISIPGIADPGGVASPP